ncbi:malto-oligosyltrehalose synthase [Desertibaculum subflavum]|uniref:malto-oligosyltrehalose synthase n=1 Tax=Desertibaculum subflavum TaxID=2268458 RepID=UPI000E670DA3
MDDELDALCRRAGIERVYFDHAGMRREADAETIRALAEALGVTGDDTADEPAAIDPVTVWRAGTGPPEIILTLAAAADPGIEWSLTEEDGTPHAGLTHATALELVETVIRGGRHWEKRRLVLPLSPAPGYHRFELRIADAPAGPAEALLIAAPSRAYAPSPLDEGARVWGISVQLYSLRSGFDWGIGDFGDLADMLRRAARAGASLVGINPVHALYLDEPARSSPYSPNSRRFLNPLYIDVEAVPDFAECAEAQALVGSAEFEAELAELRRRPLVDYPAAARCKWRILELLFRSFRDHHIARQTARARRFRAFQREHGAALQRFCVFQALRETHGRENPSLRYWRNWPIELQDPGSPAVARFAAANRQRIEYLAYLQWIAEEQAAACAAAAREAGMPIGLYKDLAVGVDGGAADAWSEQDVIVPGWSMGAPPDSLSSKGQDWGLSPLSPIALKRERYRPFIELIRANMRHAGAMRIDHILGLWRAFWIRHGEPAARGAYVRYPFADLVGILILESHRQRCLIVGEDLGTVPEGLREELERAGILSYRLLLFEREVDGRPRRPADYPSAALVAVSTHDLPTFPSFWRGDDIKLRARLGFLPDQGQVEAEQRNRAVDRDALLAAFRDERLVGDEEHQRTPVEAAYRFLARSRGQILMMHLEDPLGVIEQINVPSTNEEHPNWQLRLPHELEAVFADPRVTALCRILNAERPAPTAVLMARLAVPLSTYRLQFNARFTLRQALDVVPYLAALGISHVYASPLLKARPGSEHGYDITDHNNLNSEIGSWDDFVHFTDALRAHGMGLVLDFVPNHMGIGKADNAWWLDVLEWGQGSGFAEFFDIDWMPAKPELFGKLLLPLLGEHYGIVLERGELVLRFAPEEGALSVWYYEHRLPLRPRSYAVVIRRQLARNGDGTSIAAPLREELTRLAEEFDRVRRVGRQRRDMARSIAAGLKARLAQLCREDPAAAQFMEDATASFAGRPGDSESFRPLHGLLERQHYRLAFWRVAADEVNYRRFFNINELAGIRMENRRLFDIAHGLIGRMIAEGRLQGLRLDHVDGMFDPEAYFRRLQALARARQPAQGDATLRFYVVAEKILARHEALRPSWAIAGTTGYETGVLINGLFVDPAGEAECDEAYRSFTHDASSFEEIAPAAKDLVIENLLSSELSSLANEIDRIVERHWATRDFTRQRLRDALKAIVRHFPVYRTYVTARTITAEDRRDIDWAVKRARREWRGADVQIFDLLHDALTGDLASQSFAFGRAELARFAMRFQQYTGPVMAKSVEDTAFYRYRRLISLNEVGGDPGQFGASPAAFHHANRQRARQWPHSMLATSTHDTKRGEDARARIDVLTELPAAWRERADRWAMLNRLLRQDLDGLPAPTPGDEYMLYQALLGAWPAAFAGGALEAKTLAALTARIERYVVKAVREAKLISSWDSPNDAYEAACTAFIRGALDNTRTNPFLADFAAFAEGIAFFGMLNSLSQLALRMTIPGIPDAYQGTELWDLSLVDPDNRGEVDFVARHRRQEEIAHTDHAAAEARLDALRQDLARWTDGQIKLRLLHRLARARQEYPDLFRQGAYEPLVAVGSEADHVVALQRRYRDERAIVVAGRLFVSLLGAEARSYRSAWNDTRLVLPADHSGRWREIFTGRIWALRSQEAAVMPLIGDLLAELPVAVLVRERP